MSTPSLETLAEWRESAEAALSNPYHQHTPCPSRIVALLDALAAEKARADENEKRRARAERRADKAEAAYAALVARCKALADKWIAEDDMTQWGVHTKSRCGHALRALTEKEEG